MTVSKKVPRKIQSIGVGFSLVAVLEQAGRPLTLSQIADVACMPASQAHLYLRSFVEVGLLEYDSSTHLYSLGAYAIRLGLAAIRQNDVASASRGPMRAIQQDLQVPVYLSVWANNGPTIISKIDFDIRLPMMIRIGNSLPLTQSATGQLFLSFLQPEELEPVLERELAIINIDRSKLEALRQEVLARHYASSDSRLNTGFASIAAPVFDRDNQMVGALTLLGLRDHPTFQDIGRSAEKLSTVTKEISLSLEKR